MALPVAARFLVDHAIQPGMVRAILDTLTAQGGPYAPQMVRRSPGGTLRPIAAVRPARLLDDVAEPGTRTTFMRVAESRPQPVLSFSISKIPRTTPTEVSLNLPAETLGDSREIERFLGVSKGLYLFLEAFWGTGGLLGGPDAVGKTQTRRQDARRSDDGPVFLRWLNFFGPELVVRLGVTRLLTSIAFMVEILPDGGLMLVTHPSPHLAETPEGKTLRREIEQSLALQEEPRKDSQVTPVTRRAAKQVISSYRRSDHST